MVSKNKHNILGESLKIKKKKKKKKKKNLELCLFRLNKIKKIDYLFNE